MNRTTITDDLRHMTGGGLITAREVGQYVRDTNITRVRRRYLDGLECIRGKYAITDVAKRLQQDFKVKGNAK